MIVSQTGLVPARRIVTAKPQKNFGPKLEFQSCIKPAPMTMKPLSTLINPFRGGCSIFCNHPTNDTNLKMALVKTKRMKIDIERESERMGQVLEDILCRYGRKSPEEDSAPSSLTEELPPATRPHLVLNLRRTASQDTGRTSGGFQSSPSPSSMSVHKTQPSSTSPDKSDSRQETQAVPDGGEEGDVMKRRGKIKKKKKKPEASNETGEKSNIGLEEPKETQISTYNDADYDSDDPDGLRASRKKHWSPYPTPPLISELFDHQTLRHLRRSLTVDQVEAEFRKIWRRVLEEALKASDTLPSEERRIAEDVRVDPPKPESWLVYPRTFNRASARFDLPINKRLLSGMKPLDYLRDYVSVSKSNLLLYHHIFNKYLENEVERFISGKVIIQALGEMMGRQFTSEEADQLKDLINLSEEDEINLRTWNGLCALSERVFGFRFSFGTETDLGERPVLEVVDFDSLNKKLKILNIEGYLLKLLNAVQTL